MPGPIVSAQITPAHCVALFDADGNRCAMVRLPSGNVKRATVNGPMLTARSHEGRTYVYDISKGQPILRYAR